MGGVQGHGYVSAGTVYNSTYTASNQENSWDSGSSLKVRFRVWKENSFGARLPSSGTWKLCNIRQGSGWYSCLSGVLREGLRRKVPCCCSVSQSCPALCDPMDCSTPGLPVLHYLPEFVQTRVHRVGDAVQPSHPLSSPSPPAFSLSQHQGLFQRVALHTALS